MSTLHPFGPVLASTKTLSATDSSSSVALDDNGSHVVITSPAGNDVAYVILGGSGVTATTTQFPILPNSQVMLTRDVNTQTHIAAICASTETASLLISTGEGT